ncbi:MAG: hypothetical protein ABJM43_01450 [Paracoccaceae bacterium]
MPYEFRQFGFEPGADSGELREGNRYFLRLLRHAINAAADNPAIVEASGIIDVATTIS